MANGNIMKVETSGASWQDRGNRMDRVLPVSRHRVKWLIPMPGEWPNIRPSFSEWRESMVWTQLSLLPFISRESRAGNVIRSTGGWGDHGNGFGLMQVDVNPNGGGHKPEGEWDSEAHLNQATGILVYFIQRIEQKFPNWSAEQKLKGKDYSNDVVARAQWYKQQGY
ncbi:hypothetical protein CRUP_004338 [Coryphaenoides rupestris]|nr:hypothetical protein CRUP_004338 [Coryphaenoides rupestris]